ncbi:MAG TPA: pyruvate kinase [Sorangium sp.]|nr:pyruvate kinase [Sorangium sp.]
MKKTKIVCTLGPASTSPEVLDEMIARGMDVARLNFSHGDHAGHQSTFHRVRAAAARAGREIAILQDLQGPKIRVGKLAGNSMLLTEGQTVCIRYGEASNDPANIPTSYAAFASDVAVGDRILMDDGLLRMRVTAIEGERVSCLVEVGGVLKNRKGINLPGVKVSAPALTEKDLRDLDFGGELGVDFVCLSFVRSAADIALARARLHQHGKSTPIIAKIEKPEAVAALDEIMDAADGIMVARGDLGVELGPEKVPLIQKHCIEQANRRGKLVITATQMLESMVTRAFPSRAEASDVANAVLDHSDAVMLSAETATGAHPPLVVDTMRRIIEEIEQSRRYLTSAVLPPLDMANSTNAIARGAAAAAGSMPQVQAVVCISIHGITPTLLSDYRPRVPIIALTRDQQQVHRLAAFWGVAPILFDFAEGSPVEQLIKRADALLVDNAWLKAGDAVVVTLSLPSKDDIHTNTLTIRTIGGH